MFSPPPHEAATVIRVHGGRAPSGGALTRTVCTGVTHCAGEQLSQRWG